MRRMIAGFCLLALLLCGCAAPAEPSVEETPVVEEPAAEQTEEVKGILSSFSAVDLDGNSIDQTVLQGQKLTMVNVWATYCGPCLQEMPNLGRLAKDYADLGVQIIGLVSDAQNVNGEADSNQVELVKEIVQQTDAAYLHLVPGSGLNDLLYQITAVPTTFFVDENGVQVGGTYVGAKSLEDWTAVVEKVLGELQ